MELFVECTDCGRKVHQVCVLHFEQIWRESFTIYQKRIIYPNLCVECSNMFTIQTSTSGSSSPVTRRWRSSQAWSTGQKNIEISILLFLLGKHCVPVCFFVYLFVCLFVCLCICKCKQCSLDLVFSQDFGTPQSSPALPRPFSGICFTALHDFFQRQQTLVREAII